jgi:hypothetical protein
MYNYWYCTLYHPPSSDNSMMLEYLAKSLTDIEGHYPGCHIPGKSMLLGFSYR